MTKTYFIGDLHDGHQRILEIRPFKTIEEQRETLIKNWNSTVQDDDIVFVMGDIAFESRSKQREFLSQLRGHKHLIMGNHDKLPLNFYRQYFESVHYQILFDSPTEPTLVTYCLTHIPIRYNDLVELSKMVGHQIVNIHAHTHSQTDPALCGDSLLYPENYLCTSVEAINFAPIELPL